MNISVKNRIFSIFDPVTAGSFFILVAALLSNLTSYKVVEFAGIQASVGTLTMPLILMLLNPIAEIYGKEKSNKILLTICIVEVTFSVIFTALSHIQNDCMLIQENVERHKCEAINMAHTIVSQNIIRGAISFSIGFIVGGYLNSILLLYLKKLWSSRKYYIRDVFSSSIGEILYTVICFGIAFYGVFPFTTIVKILAFSLVFKLIATIALSWVSQFIVKVFREHKIWNESVPPVRTVKFSSRHMQI